MRSPRVCTVLFAVSLIAAACGGDGDGDAAEDVIEPTTTEEAATTTTTEAPATTTTPPPTTTRAPVESTVPTTESRVEIVGPEEMVFDWSEDRCEDGDAPDAEHDARDRGEHPAPCADRCQRGRIVFGWLTGARWIR